MTPSGNRLSTTIYYKETDTHSYLNYTSSYLTSCKNSIPFSQFLRLKRICSKEDDCTQRNREMASFFLQRDYPTRVIERSSEQVSSIPRTKGLEATTSERSTNLPRVPFVLTFRPSNEKIKGNIYCQLPTAGLRTTPTPAIFSNLCVRSPWEFSVRTAGI